MYALYTLIVGLLFYSLLPLLLLFVLITGRHRDGLAERFCLYPALPKETGKERIWLHAASVGEVQAARALIAELRDLRPRAEFVVTTMTLHGRKVAERQLAPIPCRLAPLDVPGVVGRAVKKFDPDVYVCLETELWPLLLRKAASRGVRVVQLNGRLSAKAAGGYQRWRWFFRRVLAGFTAMAVISESLTPLVNALPTQSDRTVPSCSGVRWNHVTICSVVSPTVLTALALPSNDSMAL